MTRRCPNCSNEVPVIKGQIKCPCGYHAYVDKKKPDQTPFSSYRYMSNRNGGKKDINE
jgi:DNA-directed RNA polymerase subunit RPC12/RpoP